MRDCHISRETNTAEACHPTGWLWHTCQYPSIVHHKPRIWGWGNRWRLASGTHLWFLRRARASRFRTWWSISGMTCFQSGRSTAAGEHPSATQMAQVTKVVKGIEKVLCLGAFRCLHCPTTKLELLISGSRLFMGWLSNFFLVGREHRSEYLSQHGIIIVLFANSRLLVGGDLWWL